MNKSDLIDAVHQKLGGGLSRKEAAVAVEAILGAIVEGVKKSGAVRIASFGTFKLIERKARTYVTPKTPQPVIVPASKAIRLICSDKLAATL